MDIDYLSLLEGAGAYDENVYLRPWPSTLALVTAPDERCEKHV